MENCQSFCYDSNDAFAFDCIRKNFRLSQFAERTLLLVLKMLDRAKWNMRFHPIEDDLGQFSALSPVLFAIYKFM